MQLQLPGDVDVAVQRIQDIIKGGHEPRYQFDDGESAPFSAARYDGIVNISGVLNDSEQQLITDAQTRWLERSRLLGKTQNNIPPGWDAHGKPRFEKLDIPRQGLAWRIDNEWIAITNVNKRAFVWSVAGTFEQQSEIAKSLQVLMKGLQYRPIFSVPSGAGVCLPFAFVADGGAKNRQIGGGSITYRLHNHPDITVMLEDRSAARVADFQDPNKFTAVYQSNFFWTQRYRPVKEKENLLKGSYNKIKLAGQDAVETMFKLIRKDDAEDFGYLVIARGDPESKVDMPDLMLYVIQNSKVARDKGVPPMSKADFFDLAKKISSSVKHREQ
jgi:hypothetical protein